MEEKKEIVITDKFENRLAKKVNGFNDCTSNQKQNNVSNEINMVLSLSNYEPFSKMLNSRSFIRTKCRL